jgi:hypothetical protein
MAEKDEKKQTSSTTNKAKRKSMKRIFLEAVAFTALGASVATTALGGGAETTVDGQIASSSNLSGGGTGAIVTELNSVKKNSSTKNEIIQTENGVVNVSTVDAKSLSGNSAESGQPSILVSVTPETTKKSKKIDAILNYNITSRLTAQFASATKNNALASDIKDNFSGDSSLFFTINLDKEVSTIAKVEKNEGLHFTFAAGPSLIVSGKGLTLGVAMGLAFSLDLSEHTQFFTSITAGTGIKLNGNSTFGDLLSNGAVAASVGFKITWNGKNVPYTPNLGDVYGAIVYNTENNARKSSEATADAKEEQQDQEADEQKTINYNTSNYSNNGGNDSTGADQTPQSKDNPFPANDSTDFEFGQNR